ncbi:MAG: hypothetical protein CFE45_04420 [Burkholderiales bacterium PBB5]|nr:MAG: hypothetical protein CFE45_04420 [Burkholderiales bacterium PBB5]
MARAHPLLSYWHRNLRLIAVLLLLWLGITLLVGWRSPLLDFQFFGWPFSFWMASQGALVAYCVIVWIYALVMDTRDRAEGDESTDD